MRTSRSGISLTSSAPWRSITCSNSYSNSSCTTNSGRTPFPRPQISSRFCTARGTSSRRRRSSGIRCSASSSSSPNNTRIWPCLQRWPPVFRIMALPRPQHTRTPSAASSSSRDPSTRTSRTRCTYPPHPRRMSPPSGSTTRSKRLPARSASAHPDASASTPGSGTASASAGGIRSNNGTAKRARSSTSPSITSKPTPQPGAPKQPQTLLSPSQKKANHIQSEQKRRANIRRGYEALCETVPALREAIREEEEAERNAASGQRANGPRAKGSIKEGPKGRRRQGEGQARRASRPAERKCSPFKKCALLDHLWTAKMTDARLAIEHIQDLISDRPLCSRDCTAHARRYLRGTQR